MPEHNADKGAGRPAKHLPEGNYALVSVDVDTTGRRLIDEIVQLSAYTPNDQFGQYIMPIMNLNPAARQRHQIRVITVGFFRMLKSMQSYKILKTKAEIQTLNDFLTWLEKINAETPNSQGVIMIYHEQRKFIPYVILEAMGKYGLLERFYRTVKSFADGFALAEATLDSNVKYFTLKQLAKVILQHEEVTEKDRFDFEGNASVRARLAYQIIEKVSLRGSDGPSADGGAESAGPDGDSAANKDADADDGTPAEKMQRLVRQHAAPMDDLVEALSGQTKCVERQNSLRPVFVNYFKVTLYHRVKAVTFRRILADHGYDLDTLRELWEVKKADGLHEAIAPMEEMKEEDRKELVDLLDHYFDPEKQAVLPLVKKHKSKRGGGGNNSSNANHSHSGNAKENVKPNGGFTNRGEPTSPDSLSKTPQKRSRRRRSSANAKQMGDKAAADKAGDNKAAAAATNGHHNSDDSGDHSSDKQQQHSEKHASAAADAVSKMALADEKPHMAAVKQMDAMAHNAMPEISAK